MSGKALSPADPCACKPCILQALCAANPCPPQTPVSCKPLCPANPCPLQTLCPANPAPCRPPCLLQPAPPFKPLLPATLCAAGSVTLCSPSTSPELLAGTRQQKGTGPKGQRPNCPSQDLRRCQLLLTVPRADCQNEQFSPSTQNVPDAPGARRPAGPLQVGTGGQRDFQSTEGPVEHLLCIATALPPVLPESPSPGCWSRSTVLWKTPPTCWHHPD